jgi:hypothetical protein
MIVVGLPQSLLLAGQGTPKERGFARAAAPGEGRGGLPDVEGMSTSGSMAVHVTCSRWNARCWCLPLLTSALAHLRPALGAWWVKAFAGWVSSCSGA